MIRTNKNEPLNYVVCGGGVNGGKARGKDRWLDNIRMDPVEVGWGVDWIGLAQDRDSFCEFGIEPSGSIKCWETIECPNN
jgi:hypothetical protein